MLGITLTHTTEAEHCSKLFTVETRTSGSWVHIYQVMVETRSVDVLFGLWWLFGAKPQKKNMETNTPRHSRENQFSRKKVFGGGMLSASGDTISEWNGWCVHHPPKKIMAEMPEMMLDPRFTALISISRRCFGRAKLLTPLWLIALKTQQSKGWNISPLLKLLWRPQGPRYTDFFVLFFPSFFFIAALDVSWSCSFISQPPQKITVGSYQHSTWSLRGCW